MSATPSDFAIVENKVFEADFFLGKMKECGKTINDSFHIEYYFSAFVSASRSITFAMQNAFSKLDGFKVWYEKKQNELNQSDLANFFKLARNNSQKKGTSHLQLRRFWKGQIEYFYAGSGEYKFTPKEEMTFASASYFRLILKIVEDFFYDYGEYVNPRIYYSLEKINGRGKTVRDLEMEVWGYHKWTGFGLTEEQSLSYILDNMLITNISELFNKYELVHGV